MRLAAIVFLAVPAIARGDALSDLRTSLSALQSDQTIRAQIEVKTRRSDGESDKQRKSDGNSSVVVTSGPEGLVLNWSPEQIAQSRKAAWEKTAHPDAAKSNVATLTALEASDALNLLDAADPLRRSLENAALLEDKRELYKDRPSRLLVIRLDLRLPEEGRKALKSSDAVLKLWLDASGRPLAMDRDIQMRFSKFFLSYRVHEHDAREFQIAAGRLIVTHSTHDSTGSGLGHTEESHTNATVSLLAD